MTRTNVTGVLEHIIFSLLKKHINFTIDIFKKEDGLPKDFIIVKILHKNKPYFVHVYSNPEAVTYFFQFPGENKKQISKVNLLKKLEELS